MTSPQARPMTDVRATVRLQFHQDFTLDDAVPLVSYFSRLGISHIYASPLLTARKGSMHGYDVVDPTRINPELGGEPALMRLVDELRKHRMGLILDIVSNHMAVGGDANPWWLDVLEWGPRSAYASFFDIEWQSHDPLMYGQLLLPFLRTDYGEVLEAGEITLHFDADAGRLYAAHYDHQFPLYPPTYADVFQRSEHNGLRELTQSCRHLADHRDLRHQFHALQIKLRDLAATDEYREQIDMCLAAYAPDSAEGRDRLHELLEQQYYRLASWRTASDDINWRRFFDINELGGLRVEDSAVFEATHRKIFSLVAAGHVDGLRIDHVDGLAEPRAYCRKLRRRVDRLQHAGAGDDGENNQPRFPIYVEKILLAEEQLPDDWQVTGTTGYEFADQISLLQHDPGGEAPLLAFWEQVSQRPADFMSEVYEARKLLLATSLAGDLETVCQGLLQIARDHRETRDLTLGSIRRALTGLIAHFPVYRTYAGAAGRSAADERVFQAALKGASATLSEADWPVLERIDQWLGGEALCHMAPGEKRTLRRRVLARFQQLTSPAAAKAVEDTACYRAGVLLSRYDVGFNAQQFSTTVAAFHQQSLQRSRHFPDNLLTTATHDSKRGEDMRARLAVISERPQWYIDQVNNWLQLAAPLRRQLADGVAPSPGDELILYQTLLGSWPLPQNPQNPQDPAVSDTTACNDYLQRLLGWQQKALREAKLRSNWDAINEDYEAACADFLTALLTAPQASSLRDSIAQAAMSLAPAGALNSLSQSMLRMTSPGLPDLYRGTDYWDFNLVDPDNRRPFDFQQRIESLEAASAPQQLLASWHNAHLKQWLIKQVLQARQAHSQLFSRGRYLPLEVSGVCADKVIAFARYLDGEFVVVVASIRCATLLADSDKPLVQAQHWQDTVITLPDPLHTDQLFSAVGGAPVQTFAQTSTHTSPQTSPQKSTQTPSSHSLPVADVLKALPVNLLFSSST